MYQQKIQQLARAARFPIKRYAPSHFVLTSHIIGDLRERSYFDQWQTSRTKEWFHIEMEDLSLFLFTEGEASSYSYLQCPLEIVSYRDFLKQRGLDFTKQNQRDNHEDYSILLETADLRRHVTPIRYDLDPAGYKTGAHPLAHIHIGLENNVRLGLRKKMTPVAFILFVMRQAYPQSWIRLLQQLEVNIVQNKIRTQCIEIENKWWQAHDSLEHYLF